MMAVCSPIPPHLKSPPVPDRPFDRWVISQVACPLAVTPSASCFAGCSISGPVAAMTRQDAEDPKMMSRKQNRNGEPFSLVSATNTAHATNPRACGRSWKGPTLMSIASESSSLVRIHDTIELTSPGIDPYPRNLRILTRRHHCP
jgi:hypothetical protein